jgi:hypothetical protein
MGRSLNDAFGLAIRRGADDVHKPADRAIGGGVKKNGLIGRRAAANFSNGIA